MSSYNYKKAAQLMNYFAAQEGGIISKLKAFKLIWLANRLHLRKYARSITGDKHVAMEHGPVPSNTKECLEARIFFGSTSHIKYFNANVSLNVNDVTSLTEPDLNVFSKSDISVIAEVLDRYGAFDPWSLRNHSHHFPEWKRFEVQLAASKTSFPMIMDDFFDSFDDGRGLFNQTPEYLEVIKEEYLENA